MWCAQEARVLGTRFRVFVEQGFITCTPFTPAAFP